MRTPAHRELCAQRLASSRAHARMGRRLSPCPIAPAEVDTATQAKPVAQSLPPLSKLCACVGASPAVRRVVPGTRRPRPRRPPMVWEAAPLARAGGSCRSPVRLSSSLHIGCSHHTLERRPSTREGILGGSQNSRRAKDDASQAREKRMSSKTPRLGSSMTAG